MELSLILSIVAVLISLASFSWSIHIGLRDRSKLQAKCQISGRKTKSPYIIITATNKGRRPIVLRTFGKKYADGTTSLTQLENKNGITLNEGEFYQEESRNDYNLLFSAEGAEAVSLWFEDSVGNKHSVRNSKRILKNFFAKKDDK